MTLPYVPYLIDLNSYAESVKGAAILEFRFPILFLFEVKMLLVPPLDL